MFPLPREKSCSGATFVHAGRATTPRWLAYFARLDDIASVDPRTHATLSGVPAHAERRGDLRDGEPARQATNRWKAAQTGGPGVEPGLRGKEPRVLTTYTTPQWDGRDSDPRHAPMQGAALPTELPPHKRQRRPCHGRPRSNASYSHSGSRVGVLRLLRETGYGSSYVLTVSLLLGRGHKGPGWTVPLHHRRFCRTRQDGFAFARGSRPRISRTFSRALTTRSSSARSSSSR